MSKLIGFLVKTVLVIAAGVAAFCAAVVGLQKLDILPDDFSLDLGPVHFESKNDDEDGEDIDGREVEEELGKAEWL